MRRVLPAERPVLARARCRLAGDQGRVRRRRPPGVIQARGHVPAAGGHSRTGPGTLSRAAVRCLPANVAAVSSTTDRDARTWSRLEQHWKASEDGDADTEHAIYAADAVL